ncbi:hypothetical protein AAVH_17117 [Aphelenchoides avenae]|nr:hypothetical protein AAVH_17116 [Aphelenchus avenae]KAH7715477.1 hypothetical protein AAVH_17117 [Aphelenchus avenae]
MNPKLLEIVIENITQKCLPDEDEAKLVSKLMLVVLKGEATAEEATQNRCISATKLQDYVNAARIALKSFDEVIQQAISQVRRSGTGCGQVPTDEDTIIEQEMVDIELQATPTHASSENAWSDAGDVQPPKRARGPPSKKRSSTTITASVANAGKKSKTVEPHDADTSGDSISEFCMPDAVVQMDATAQNWTAMTAADIPRMAPATKKMKLKFTTLEDGTVLCGHCKMTFQTRSGVYNHYLNRHASAEDIFSCTQCNVKCLKQKALERHVLRKHTSSGPSNDADEPSISSHSKLDVSQGHVAAAPLPGDPTDVQDNSSSNNWLLSMCNVSVKKELDQYQAE